MFSYFKLRSQPFDWFLFYVFSYIGISCSYEIIQTNSYFYLIEVKASKTLMQKNGLDNIDIIFFIQCSFYFI